MKIALGIAVAALAALAGSAVAQTGYGITRSNTIFSFDAAAPGTVLTSAAISGLGANESVLSIDARPLNGQLVILTSASQLYSVDAAGNTVALGAAFMPALGNADYSIDFNPTVDRIRVVGGVGGTENFRLNPLTGGRVAGDTALSFAGGGGPNAQGVAYRNWNFGFNAAAGSVREYGIDATANGLNLIEIGTMAGGNASFNAGVTTTIGALGISSNDGFVGFDIFGPSDTAFVSSNIGTTFATLYTVNFATGAATSLGDFSVIGVRDITFLPTPGAASLVGLAGLVALRRRR